MPTTSPHRPWPPRRQAGGARVGFTIIESMIASVVLAACVVALGTALNISYAQSQVAEDEVLAVSFARQMLEEIAAKPFVDPDGTARALGPDSGESGRAQFDNMDDYHGYADASTSQLVADGTTLDLSKSRSFARSVSAEYRANPHGPADSDGDLLFVTVTIQTPAGRTISLPRLFSSLSVE